MVHTAHGVDALGALQGPTPVLAERITPSGSLTDPEYALLGLTEAKARENYDVVTAVVRFDETVRTTIEGRTFGFCTLIPDRKTHRILGCHVVGERAVEIAQVGLSRSWQAHQVRTPSVDGAARSRGVVVTATGAKG